MTPLFTSQNLYLSIKIIHLAQGGKRNACSSPYCPCCLSGPQAAGFYTWEGEKRLGDTLGANQEEAKGRLLAKASSDWLLLSRSNFDYSLKVLSIEPLHPLVVHSDARNFFFLGKYATSWIVFLSITPHPLIYPSRTIQERERLLLFYSNLTFSCPGCKCYFTLFGGEILSSYNWNKYLLQSL